MGVQGPGGVAVIGLKVHGGDERWALVLRVVGSRGFSKAAQLRDLLLYAARASIESPGVEPTEQELGSRVLGRRPDYDPQEDNIVRVQVRHLRQKLEEYFATQGSDEAIVITIPKGSRIPLFQPRVPPEVPHAQPVAPAPKRSRIPRSIWLAGVMALVGLAAFYAGRQSAGSTRAQVAGQSRVPLNPLLARLFTAGQETTIVIADSSLVILQDVLGTSITLNDYIDGAAKKLAARPSEPGLRAALERVGSRQYTSLADATISGKFYSIGRQSGSNVRVRYARHMNVRDFHAGNFVFVGSKRSVPWVELFDPELNFLFERIGNEGLRFGFRNVRPQEGESEVYSCAFPTDKPHDTYATLALLPNLSHNGVVLLLNGASMESSEAAGEFAMSDRFPEVIGRLLGAPPNREIPFFELLLRAHVTAGAPDNAEVLAWRRPRP